MKQLAILKTSKQIIPRAWYESTQQLIASYTLYVVSLIMSERIVYYYAKVKKVLKYKSEVYTLYLFG